MEGHEIMATSAILGLASMANFIRRGKVPMPELKLTRQVLGPEPAQIVYSPKTKELP